VDDRSPIGEGSGAVRLTEIFASIEKLIDGKEGLARPCPNIVEFDPRQPLLIFPLKMIRPEANVE
jgi:hypothetical protein